MSGFVNTDLPGIYYLTYKANDSIGNPLTPVTRTVHVIVNNAGFLNGSYNVACTCNAIPKSGQRIVSSETYTAVVMPERINNHFKLVTLNIGFEKLVPQESWLSGNKVFTSYYSRDVDYTTSGATGTLSSTKNSFTIQTLAQRYSPVTKYLCDNVYTKLLTIKPGALANKDK